MRSTRLGVGAGLLLGLALVPSARAQGPADTRFTYQGRLTVSGAPGSGAYDFEFVLYDAPVGGAPVGPAVAREDVTVTEGLFTVLLDFGNVFGIERRFLELRVRAGASSDPFTPVLPRQEVTPAPSATFSAESANAQALGGVPASQFVRTDDPRLSDARVPLPGSADYVQNGSVAQPGVSFNVGGTGAADVLDAATGFHLAGAPILRAPGTGTLFVGFEAGAASTGTFNSFAGFHAGALNDVGSFNTFLGAEAGAANVSGHQNTYVGRNAGRNATGHANTYLGRNAGNNDVSGTFNTILGWFADVGAPNLVSATAIGAGARVNTSNTLVLGTSGDTVEVPGAQAVALSLSVGGALTVAGPFQAATLDAATHYRLGGARVLGVFNTNLHVGTGAGSETGFGFRNTFVGIQAGRNDFNGVNNSYFGAEAGRDNTSGQNNSFFGPLVGQANTASNNSFFGALTGPFNTTGGDNSFFGHGAGNRNTTGAGNVFLGSIAGSQNTTGSDNTFVGRDADWLSSSLNGDGVTLLGAGTRAGLQLASATAIGHRAQVNQGNAIVLGAIAGVNGATASTNVGIGTANPNARLHVVDGVGILFGASSGCPGVVGLAFGTAIGSSCQNYALFGGDGNTYINRPNGGSIVFRSGNTAHASINPFGVLNLPVLGGSGAQALCRNASNDLAFCSSSLRYKEDVAPLREGLEVVERLRPIHFTWKATGQRDVGLAAEEVARVDPLLAFRNAEGEVEGVNYSQLTAVLVRALQQQQAQIDALKALVCEAQPEAGPCVDLAARP